MNDGTWQNPRGRVLWAFFIGSVLSGLFFAWCVTRPSLQGYWFRTEGIWTFPTGKLWLLATGLFFLNLVGSSFIALLKRWLSFSAYRLIIGGTLFALVPVLVWLMEPMSALSQLVLFRFTLALVISLTLLFITRRWYWSLATLMMLGSLTTPLIASIPFAFLKSVSLEWFEVSKFFVSSSLLALLFGFWLLKSFPIKRPHVESVFTSTASK